MISSVRHKFPTSATAKPVASPQFPLVVVLLALLVATDAAALLNQGVQRGEGRVLAADARARAKRADRLGFGAGVAFSTFAGARRHVQRDAGFDERLDRRAVMAQRQHSVVVSARVRRSRGEATSGCSGSSRSPARREPFEPGRGYDARVWCGRGFLNQRCLLAFPSCS